MFDSILAADPGKMTGWSLWRADYPLSVWSGQMTMDEFLDWINKPARVDAPPGKRTAEPFFVFEDGAMLDYPSAVVCESYVVTAKTLQKSRGENWSLEQIGALRSITTRLWSGTFETQTPSDAKGFSTDEKLKRLGWYQAGKGHANDASRHLLLFLVRQHLLDPSFLLAPQPPLAVD